MTVKTSYKSILIAAVFIVLTVNPNCGQNSLQSQSSLTIEQAKERLEQLHDEYSSIDVIFRQKIEAEVVKQVGTSPKGEFESTPEYQARLARAESIRKGLKATYEQERIRRKSEIKKQIDYILDLEFTKPVVINIGTYDADGEIFPLSVVDPANNETYKDVLFVPRSEARFLKERFSEAEKRGLFGISLEDGKPVEYFFTVRINFQGKQYSSLVPEHIYTQAELARIYLCYKDPYVMYLRKVFDAYLKRNAAKEGEIESIKQYDEEYFRSKFIVLSIEPAPMGGKIIDIAFQDRPDAVFQAWVSDFIYVPSPYKLRSFDATITDKQMMRKIRTSLRQSLQDKIHAL